MIYRIDIQHFLSHAIDHFTSKELTDRSTQYAIVSAKIASGGRAINVVKINDLYPNPEIIISYDETKDKDLMERMYFDQLDPNRDKKDITYKDVSHIATTVYRAFVNPLILHYNVIIICDEIENPYVDALCKFLKKYYAIEVIDLNELFIKGKVGPIHIDRAEIRDKAVDIRRAAVSAQAKSLESTREGREKLIGMMTFKEKAKRLKQLGVKINKSEKDKIDQILLDAWNEEFGDDSN